MSVMVTLGSVGDLCTGGVLLEVTMLVKFRSFEDYSAY